MGKSTSPRHRHAATRVTAWGRGHPLPLSGVADRCQDGRGLRQSNTRRSPGRFGDRRPGVGLRRQPGRACESATLGLLLLLIAGHGLPARAAETNAAVERALAELVKPSRGLPFKNVIHATTGWRVLDFDTNNPAHLALQRSLQRAATLAGKRARRSGLVTARANEAGNHLEPFVRAALPEAGLPARVPVTAAGRAQASGYPDIEITGPTPCYLELKTYSAGTADTTQRSFYYSPSATPKVTRDALHLLLAYELEKRSHDGRTVFVPVRWRLLSLEDLEVDLKFEFNQSNRRLYRDTASPLGGGTVE